MVGMGVNWNCCTGRVSLSARVKKLRTASAQAWPCGVSKNSPAARKIAVATSAAVFSGTRGQRDGEHQTGRSSAPLERSCSGRFPPPVPGHARSKLLRGRFSPGSAVPASRVPKGRPFQTCDGLCFRVDGFLALSAFLSSGYNPPHGSTRNGPLLLPQAGVPALP